MMILPKLTTACITPTAGPDLALPHRSTPEALVLPHLCTSSGQKRILMNFRMSMQGFFFGVGRMHTNTELSHELRMAFRIKCKIFTSIGILKYSPKVNKDAFSSESINTE